MGEAKRRKQLDPNYGKNDTKLITTFELSKILATQHGKGVFVYPGKGLPFCYLTTNSEHLKELDKIMIQIYNPENQFVFSHPCVEGDCNSLFLTKICDANSREGCLRVYKSIDGNYSKNIFD
jgi:hypothetical protein